MHALEQMLDREISMEEAVAVVRSVDPSRTIIRGEPSGESSTRNLRRDSRLFVAVEGGTVVTVFRARAAYVAGLKRRS
jgi:hypothetical protein